MGSFRDVYVEAIEEKYGYPKGWHANWPLGFDISLGDVGTISDDSFSKGGKLADKGLHADVDPAPGSPDGEWNYTSNKDIAISISGDAKTPGFEFIGNARAGVIIGFKKQQSLVLSVESSHQTGFLNIDGLKAQLLEAGKQGTLPRGTVIVVEQHVADHGLYVESMGQEGEFKATTDFEVAPGGQQSLASFAVSFGFKSESGGITHESFPNGFTIAYRGIELGTRGWFWWREPVVTDIVEAESSLGRDDYFAAYPDADFPAG